MGRLLLKHSVKCLMCQLWSCTSFLWLFSGRLIIHIPAYRTCITPDYQTVHAVYLVTVRGTSAIGFLAWDLLCINTGSQGIASHSLQLMCQPATWIWISNFFNSIHMWVPISIYFHIQWNLRIKDRPANLSFVERLSSYRVSIIGGFTVQYTQSHVI